MSDIHHVTSEALSYLLSKPRGNAPAKGFPILVFLHGWQEAAPKPIQEAMIKFGPLDIDNPPHVKEQFIIVAPQMPIKGDYWDRFSDTVKAIAIKVQNEENGDKNRTYLTGFSFGGNGVFEVAVRQLNFWAALWPVDLTRVPENDPQRPIWISVGIFVRMNLSQFVTKLGLLSAKLNFDADRVHDDTYRTHIGAAEEAYKDEKIYRWLLTKSLSIPYPKIYSTGILKKYVDI
uniref:Phospholipase/carboxylesterase/thioesterase domain-containing protein n=1 Tax=Panagrolaimus sp. ES5 TaxID=591445 RepID=A0AC34GSP2_9BILA